MKGGIDTSDMQKKEPRPNETGILWPVVSAPSSWSQGHPRLPAFFIALNIKQYIQQTGPHRRTYLTTTNIFNPCTIFLHYKLCCRNRFPECPGGVTL